jgi:pimeloyl-ACP methyl ester carboxylesterase
MSVITTKHGVEIFYKDWGSGQPIVFSHGWPLSGADRERVLLNLAGALCFEAIDAGVRWRG